MIFCHIFRYGVFVTMVAIVTSLLVVYMIWAPGENSRIIPLAHMNWQDIGPMLVLNWHNA